MKIFISYTMRDGEIKESLLRDINSLNHLNNLVLFIDKLHNNDSNPQSRIKKEIESSDILLLLSSKKVFESKWVKKEILLAQELSLPIHFANPKNMKRIIKSVHNKVQNDK
ncbi:TIR domain-containing protein [Winogradskyella sp. 3972H.M.0a.05]|uniref:TIR domain-containing protein n=1 Tax=Winogradskyella sp. 3972H.M.0a.05 TaxID=2950277 RepID=UPI0033952BC7